MEVSMNKIEIIFLWLSFCDMTVPSKKQCTVLVTLTVAYEGQCFFSELSTNL